MTQRQQDEDETTQDTHESTKRNRIASGTYLSQLRHIKRKKYRGYSQNDVAKKVEQEGVSLSPGHLLKIEGGKHLPQSHLVSCILKVVGGDIDDYRALLLDEAATTEDGMRMALQRTEKEEEKQRLRRFIDAMGGEESLQEWLSNPDIVTIQEGMRRYPYLIDQFVALVHVEDKRNQ